MKRNPNPIERARTAKGWTKYRLAKEAGIHQGRIAWWESQDDLGAMELRMAFALVEALGGALKITDLLPTSLTKRAARA